MQVNSKDNHLTSMQKYDQAPVPGRFLDYSQDLLHLFLLTLVYKNLYSFSIFLKCLHVNALSLMGRAY